MVVAHVKWFVEGIHEVSPFTFHEPTVQIWLLVSLAFLLLAGALNILLKKKKIQWEAWAIKYKSHFLYFFQLTLAASLIFATKNQVILVPHYEGAHLIIMSLQLATAFFLILNRWVYLGAGFLLVTYLSTALMFGPLESLDYINILGMSLFLFLEKSSFKFFKKWKIWSLDVLRISTGAALVILAFSEKLLDPSEAMKFLGDYNVNFMTALGLNYSDRLFVLSAGCMELVFGLIMIIGIIPRINVAVLASFMVMSNLFFFIQGYHAEGWTELMGHLPVIGTAVLLFIYGKSFNKK